MTPDKTPADRLLNREDLGQSILVLCGGNETEAVFLALADALGVLVAGTMAGQSDDECGQLIDELAENAKTVVKNHKGKVEVFNPS